MGPTPTLNYLSSLDSGTPWPCPGTRVHTAPLHPLLLPQNCQCLGNLGSQTSPDLNMLEESSGLISLFFLRFVVEID